MNNQGQLLQTKMKTAGCGVHPFNQAGYHKDIQILPPDVRHTPVMSVPRGLRQEDHDSSQVQVMDLFLYLIYLWSIVLCWLSTRRKSDTVGKEETVWTKQEQLQNPQITLLTTKCHQFLFFQVTASLCFQENICQRSLQSNPNLPLNPPCTLKKATYEDKQQLV